MYVVLKVHEMPLNKARWLSWLERRPVTAEVVGSSPRRSMNGPVAQLVRAPPCHGGGREFESLLGRLLVTFSEQAINNYIWDHSSAGRASALQAEGHRFEPYWSHFVIVSYHDLQVV